MWMVNVLMSQETWRKRKRRSRNQYCLGQDLSQFHFQDARKKISNTFSGAFRRSLCFPSHHLDLWLLLPYKSPWASRLYPRLWDTKNGVRSLWLLFKYNCSVVLNWLPTYTIMFGIMLIDRKWKCKIWDRKEHNEICQNQIERKHNKFSPKTTTIFIYYFWPQPHLFIKSHCHKQKQWSYFNSSLTASC